MNENRIYNEGQYEGKDDDFWMTSNDVPPPNGRNFNNPNRNNEVAGPDHELGNSLKATSSFHPVQHQKYNLWLNDDKNTDFFNKTPRYLKKIDEGKRYIPKTKGSRVLKGMNRVKRRKKGV